MPGSTGTSARYVYSVSSDGALRVYGSLYCLGLSTSPITSVIPREEDSAPSDLSKRGKGASRVAGSVVLAFHSCLVATTTSNWTTGEHHPCDGSNELCNSRPRLLRVRSPRVARLVQ